MPDCRTMEATELRIAILSGKGGTGKTLVAVNLAAAAGSSYMDCDVEEPNGHLFLKPAWSQTETVTVKVPVVDRTRCTGCRRCVDFCRYGALAYTSAGLMILPKNCHSCGGCILVCPEQALTERERTIGTVQKGFSAGVHCHSGILEIGEPSGVPIIHHLLKSMGDLPNPVFLDCSPGSSCLVMESIRDVDYCVLVAEPTLFGLHNLEMVWELVRLFKKPCGVVLNKVLPGENLGETFCQERGITILAQIPFHRDLGLLTSQGKIAVKEASEYKSLFSCLLTILSQEVHCETVAYS